MKEFRYKAWEKRKKKMWCIFAIDPYGQILAWDGMNERWVTTEKDSYILREFTGRKDKSKEEIYDGDIVKFNHYEEHGNTGRMMGEVYWNNEESCWAIYSENNEIGMGTKNGLFLSWAKNIEIIGNKYENPELQEEY